jgi:hypothetical protein
LPCSLFSLFPKLAKRHFSLQNCSAILASNFVPCYMHTCTGWYLFNFNFFFSPPPSNSFLAETLMVCIEPDAFFLIIRPIYFCNFLHTGFHGQSIQRHDYIRPFNYMETFTPCIFLAWISVAKIWSRFLIYCYFHKKITHLWFQVLIYII